ncbi:MAG: hypothetical protein ACR2KW_11980 [Rubrobacter sp.]
MGTNTRATPSRAVVEACRLWRERRLDNLLRQDIPWQTVRRSVLGLDFLGTRWNARSGGRAMRLTRYGLEFRENGAVRRYSWKQMQDITHHGRN